MAKPGYYPIILIPKSIQSAQSQLPELPEFTLAPPSNPGPKPKQFRKRIVATQSAIAAFPGVIVAAQPKARLAGLGLMTAALVAIAVRTWRKFIDNQHRSAAHQQYHYQMSVYQEEIRRYETEREEAITAFQLKLVLQILSESLPPDGSNSRARRGWSESTFQEHLEYFFPGKIQTGETVYREKSRRFPYTPDFVYFDPQTRLYADIEIDEPYAYRNRKPTHYIDCEKDEARNQAILKRGWLIIRFSEEQVVRWPERSCKTVAEAIANVLGNEILDNFVDIPSLEKQSRWTKEEAIAMAEQAFRQEYLKAS